MTEKKNGRKRGRPEDRLKIDLEPAEALDRLLAVTKTPPEKPKADEKERHGAEGDRTP